LEPTIFIVGVGDTNFHVPFWIRALNSVIIASLHTASFIVEVKQVGSMVVVVRNVVKA
jgi:hypothetical protein